MVVVWRPWVSRKRAPRFGVGNRGPLTGDEFQAVEQRKSITKQDDHGENRCAGDHFIALDVNRNLGVVSTLNYLHLGNGQEPAKQRRPSRSVPGVSTGTVNRMGLWRMLERNVKGKGGCGARRLGRCCQATGKGELLCVVARIDGPCRVHLASGEYRQNGYELVAKRGTIRTSRNSLFSNREH